MRAIVAVTLHPMIAWTSFSSESSYSMRRAGLDLEKEPPAVRMNDMLGGILTYKLKVRIRIVYA